MHFPGLGGAGPERHGPATGGADRQSREQDRTRDHPRWRHARVALLEQALNPLEHGGFDDLWYVGENLLPMALATTRPRLDVVEAHPAGIDGVGEQGVDRPDAPGRSAARAIAVRVEPYSDGLDPHRAGSSIALQKQAEDQPHGLGFYRVDGEPLLDAAAPAFHLNGPVAERRLRPVPVALPGILLHGAQDVLGVLLRLVFVEQRDHLPHHHLRRVVAQLLGDRHEPDAMFGQLAYIEFETERIAEEAREGVHDDHVEDVLSVTGALDHPLELGSPIVGRGCAELDVFGRNESNHAARPKRAFGPSGPGSIGRVRPAGQWRHAGKQQRAARTPHNHCASCVPIADPVIRLAHLGILPSSCEVARLRRQMSRSPPIQISLARPFSYRASRSHVGPHRSPAQRTIRSNLGRSREHADRRYMGFSVEQHIEELGQVDFDSFQLRRADWNVGRQVAGYSWQLPLLRWQALALPRRKQTRLP